VHLRSLLCERTRGWVSLSLDGELSEFERALMDAHVARCLDCAAFAGEARQTTAMLRSAPLEPLPQALALPVRRRRIGAGALRVSAAAAMVVGALGLAGSVNFGSPPVSEITADSSMVEDQNTLIRELKRADLTPRPLIDRGRRVLTIPL
jgi:ferric-dicitrate binding protein FerR (iron transport regulator)